MQWLKENTTKIRRYIDADTDESLTHAALECRIAIELVCYERLRIAHDYISHKDILRWQPRHVIEVLVALGNDDAAQSFTLSISQEPIEGDRELEVADFVGMDWVEVGRQVGFDPAHIGKIWQGLSHFLHVQVPRSRSDDLRAYGDKETLRRKVLEALAELDRLSEGTLISSGTGEEVSFDCVCGITNKRKESFFSPDCACLVSTLLAENSIESTNWRMNHSTSNGSLSKLSVAPVRRLLIFPKRRWSTSG